MINEQSQGERATPTFLGARVLVAFLPLADELWPIIGLNRW
jgi:hypothetical protein